MGLPNWDPDLSSEGVKFMTRKRKKKNEDHPTRIQLIEVACEFLEEFPLNEITVNMVLEKSEVSSGSLYYHFQDFGELLETSIIKLFTSEIYDNIKIIIEKSFSSENREIFLKNFSDSISELQSEKWRSLRFRRARIIGMSIDKPKLMEKISQEQEQITDSISSLFKHYQDIGWFSKNFDHRAASSFVQAFIFGKILDDILEYPCENNSWADISVIFMKSLFSEQMPRLEAGL
jgi:AcrR family transcriptional regulator